MEDVVKKDLNVAIRIINSLISKSEKAKEKFRQGTSQYTLQTNRIKALKIAELLITKELDEDDSIDCYTREDFEKTLDPITSLISKSEKAQKKLPQGSWQHTILSNNIKALYIVLPLLTKALSKIE